MLSDVKDLLMLDASFNLSPAAKVDFCFSEPARSTKCILEERIEKPSPDDRFSFELIYKVKIECDREDYRFIFVSAVVLFLIPFYKFYTKSE